MAATCNTAGHAAEISFGFLKAQTLLMMKFTGIAIKVDNACAQYDLVRKPVESSRM